MKPLTLHEVAQALHCRPAGDGMVSSVCIDTRKIEPGCLFFCIKGERFDGNTFANQALELGAGAVVCHTDAVCSGPALRVPDTREALLELAAYYRGKFEIPLVGLTGSVGKTTTKEMIHLVLSAKYKTLKTQGNLNNEIGLPMTLFQMEADTEAAVIEMGMNHFGEISRLSRTARPNIGVITNIGISHIENLGSREGILKAKMELTEGLADGAPLLLNGDDPLLSDVKSENFTKILYGLDNGDYRAVHVRQQAMESCFTVAYPGGSQEVALPAAGLHHVSNALAAFAVGHRLGVAPADAAGRLSRYQPEGMRQRVISVGGRICIEDCYNASPDSMKAALATLRQLAGRRRIAVLADMLELGAFAREAHEMVGRMAAGSGADALYVYGDEAQGYIHGAKGAGLECARYFASKEELAEQLGRDAHAGDVILFKASRSMKMEEVMRSVYERWKTDE